MENWINLVYIILNNQIAAVRFSPDDPLWAVNMKKAIASQLQLHTQKSTAPFEFQDPPTLKNSNFFTVYEVFSPFNYSDQQ